MAYSNKPLSENEKKAKMTALKSAHSMATDQMKQTITKGNGLKDSGDLKKHVKAMSAESGIDWKGDSDHISDPENQGNVIGRHISDENIDATPDDQSVYDIDARIQELMEQKSRMRRG